MPHIPKLLGQQENALLLRPVCVDAVSCITAFHADQLLETLEAAHKAGWIHRDIRPANLLVDPASANELIIIDWGFAVRTGTDEPVAFAGALINAPDAVLAALEDHKPFVPQPLHDLESAVRALVCMAFHDSFLGLRLLRREVDGYLRGGLLSEAARCVRKWWTTKQLVSWTAAIECARSGSYAGCRDHLHQLLPAACKWQR